VEHEERRDLGSSLLEGEDHRGMAVVEEEVHSTSIPASSVDSVLHPAAGTAWIHSAVEEGLLDSRWEGENEDRLGVGREGDEDSSWPVQSQEEPRMEVEEVLADLSGEEVERGRTGGRGDEVARQSQISIGCSGVLRRDSVAAEVAEEGEEDGEEENRSLMVERRVGTEEDSDNSAVSTA
jgi:hypothetical protein